MSTSALVKIVVALLLALLTLAATLAYREQVHKGRISALRAEHAEESLIATRAAAAMQIEMQTGRDMAVRRAYERQQDIDDANSSLAAERDRLRDEARTVPARISAATRAAVDKYASACTAVFEQCADRYSEMAQRADRHASDVLLMTEAWPSLNATYDGSILQDKKTP